jgi:hypothetical protein
MGQGQICREAINRTAVALPVALAIAVLAPKRAPWRAGTPSNKTFVAVIYV